MYSLGGLFFISPKERGNLMTVKYFIGLSCSMSYCGLGLQRWGKNEVCPMFIWEKFFFCLWGIVDAKIIWALWILIFLWWLFICLKTTKLQVVRHPLRPLLQPVQPRRLRDAGPVKDLPPGLLQVCSLREATRAGRRVWTQEQRGVALQRGQRKGNSDFVVLDSYKMLSNSQQRKI